MGQISKVVGSQIERPRKQPEPTTFGLGDRVRKKSGAAWQGCVVGWSPDEGALLCPCHAAQFNKEGQAVKGPAKLPLPVLNARVADGIVFVEV